MNLEKADFPNLEVVFFFFFHFVKDRDCSDFLLWLISWSELCSYASERPRTSLEIEVLEKL